ncbi:MAG: hypothetical protein HY306_10540 [Nitrosomonadales bacterium]|nr:hypothetical protein [Nitrosomonadales bacterium]
MDELNRAQGQCAVRVVGAKEYLSIAIERLFFYASSTRHSTTVSDDAEFHDDMEVSGRQNYKEKGRDESRPYGET